MKYLFLILMFFTNSVFANDFLTVTVTWQTTEDLKSVCNDQTSKSCSFLVNKTCEIHAVKPKDFNDHKNMYHLGVAYMNCIEAYENNNKEK